MRPPRLIFVAFCLIFFPIFLTLYSVLTSSPTVSTPSSLGATGLHAFFSFNLPSSLFPPSAIISLTDENSTFFLARPAAFGPLLPDKGLSGQLWVGTGFGAGKELGCSDIPGWREGDDAPQESRVGKSGFDDQDTGVTPGKHHADFLQGPKPQSDAHTGSLPSNDGTDDHLHHPLPESFVVDSAEKNRDTQTPKGAHADIQSLQETAEISGQVVLLSRGGCGFLEKVKWAQRRGARAVIVGDDTRGGSLVTMYARGDTSNVTIPALFTSYTTAHLLSSLIPPQDREEPSIEGTKTLVPEAETTPAASATITPSSTPKATSASKSESGFLSKVLASLGLSGDASSSSHDNRRPPSSGNIDWVPLGLWDDQESSRGRVGDDAYSKSDKTSQANAGDGDGFVIGVQDWRDPDLVAPKSSSVATPTGSTASETKEHNNKDTQSLTLKGGSITPGSGEYYALEKSVVEDKTRKIDSRRPAGSSDGTRSKGWFSRHFLGVMSEKSGPARSEKKQVTHDVQKDANEVKTDEHEGLWVTLTPTSMSTSPFFDTLLVLVVSPLLTLSVVYILLLLRSRIRRRRWRAPKSLVERLPVRTYHTIPSISSSSSSSVRSSSPGPVTQTSPLLGAKSESRSRSQYQKAAPKAFERREPSGTSTWRRKYTGRQVECVVCLEEYIDGQSRVMSLPCGHEFHAECITPWLTTRRRTCPICKGDVVRSMSHTQQAETQPDQESDSRHSASAPVPISPMTDQEISDLERHVSADTGLDRSSTSPSWRNFAALSLSALSGDTIWHQGHQTQGHQGRADNDN
ncbi:PA and RING finger domain protein [Aspergillus undulatus]|uniref:PA and RING finger domain protein n=1 Tax=Aspergillus undulatus TaxID=1810928 RepID=UPI003CCDBC62